VKQLRDWLFNFATPVSLVLCIVVVAIWIDCRFYEPIMQWHIMQQSIWARVNDGGLVIDQMRFVPEEPIGWWAGPYVRNDPRLQLPPQVQQLRRYKTDHFLMGFSFGNSAAMAQWSRIADQLARAKQGTSSKVPLRHYAFAVRRLVVPLHFITLVTFILPATWVILRVRGRRRRQPGLCRVCGYDLRATPDRCPECGTVPVKILTARQMRVGSDSCRSS
jgi:hypothetical protein